MLFPVGPFLSVVGGEHVLSAFTSHFGAGFCFLRRAEVLQFLFPLFSFRYVLLVSGWHRLLAEERFFRRFVATGEDTIKRVIIFRRDRVELMVVTTSAGDG